MADETEPPWARWARLNPERKRAQSRASYLRNREAVLARTAKYQRDNREQQRGYARNYRQRNPEKHAAKTRRHQKANPELWAAYAKRWREKYPDRARKSMRPVVLEYFARRRRSEPTWADRSALLAVYRACPEGMTVDHIVPLGGRKRPALTAEGYQVSGLHVPWNLQYLSLSANSKKGNRMTFDEQALCECFTH